MKLWRNQGVNDKLHNLFRFIRASSQRDALFFDIADLFPNAGDEIDVHTWYLTVIDDSKTR